MNGVLRADRRRGILLPTLLTLLAFAALVALGKWQLDRKVWKEDLIATLEARLSAEPQPLPPPSTWGDLAADQDEFRRVSFSADLEPDMAALVYGGGSTFHPDVAGPGYFVFAPARLPGGGIVVVDRGFVPDGRRDAASDPAGERPGRLDMIGVLRWPERPGWFTPAPDVAGNLWFVRDPGAIAQAKGWGEAAPFYIELESPAPPNGLPRPTVLKVNLPDNHLQYALTWFGLAAALAGVFLVWVSGRWREMKPSR